MQELIQRFKGEEEELPLARSSYLKKRALCHNLLVLESEVDKIEKNYYEHKLESKISSYVSAYRNFEAALQSISKKRKPSDASDVCQAPNVVLVQRQALQREESVQAAGRQYLVAGQDELGDVPDVHEDVVHAEMQH